MNKNMDKFKFKRAYYNFKYFLDFSIADLLMKQFSIDQVKY